MLLGYICHCVALENNDDVQIAARKKEKLFIDGISLLFAGKLDNWLKGSYYFPDMMMSDMEAYLSKNNDMKSAKEGKNLYESGHVTDVEYNNISDCLKFVMYVEKLSRKRESEKTRTLTKITRCFASVFAPWAPHKIQQN